MFSTPIVLDVKCQIPLLLQKQYVHNYLMCFAIYIYIYIYMAQTIKK